jgi:hypothetical protein
MLSLYRQDTEFRQLLPRGLDRPMLDGAHPDGAGTGYVLHQVVHKHRALWMQVKLRQCPPIDRGIGLEQAGFMREEVALKIVQDRVIAERALDVDDVGVR